MALVSSSNNNDDIIIPTLPAGFEVCNHSHTCPSCKSTLVYKVPTAANTDAPKAMKEEMKEENTQKKEVQNNVVKSMFASTACYCTTTASDDDDTLLNDLSSTLQDEENDIQHTLTTAQNANKLLQALSFDASTRHPPTKMGLDLCNVTENVSYCLDCKVHVITTSRELELLFDDADENGVVGVGSGDGGGDELGGNNMEWLRGSLLVDVDESEVLARGRMGLSSVPSIQEQNTGLSSILGNYNTATAATEEGGKPSPYKDRDEPNKKKKEEAVKLPTRPNHFDYEYRHKVATQTMASRIVKGYTLVDEICEECEMPLMIKNREDDDEEVGVKDAKEEKSGKECKKECVVCPKLYKKIARYAQSGGYAHPSPSAGNGTDGTSLDPILAIIANARSEAPTQTKRYVQPDIAEAKQYVMQRQIMSQTAVSSSPPEIKSLVDNCCEDGKEGTGDGCSSQGTVSMTDHESEDNDQLTLSTGGAEAGGKNKLNIFHNNTNPGINWDELLFNGRTILSKRLNEGWVLSSTNCDGANCKGTPLLQRLDNENSKGEVLPDTNYCAVCGGTGSGEDGAYAVEIALQVKAAELAERAIQESTPNWEELAGKCYIFIHDESKSYVFISSTDIIFFLSSQQLMAGHYWQND